MHVEGYRRTLLESLRTHTHPIKLRYPQRMRDQKGVLFPSLSDDTTSTETHTDATVPIYKLRVP